MAVQIPARAIIGLVVGLTCGGWLRANGQAEFPLLLEEDFERGMDRWQTTDPDPATGVWRVIEQGAGSRGQGAGSRAERETGAENRVSERLDHVNHVLRVTGQSKYGPPHRSPHSIAWLKDIVVKDFVLTARVQNTNPGAGPHRDLCIFWGYQDPAHFYYVHLGAQPDPAACQIFIVNDAPRTAITVDKAQGTPWTDGWHMVKVIRRVADGTMEVYFDNMEKPLMTARDTKFGAGRVGIGTFDDHGNFDDIVLRGERESSGAGEQESRVEVKSEK
jgi:hypothetical protein